MPERYYVETPIASNAVTLTGDEAHHLARVMRAAVGDVIWLFDGSGQEFEARITSLRKQAAELEILSQRSGKVSPSTLTLAVALPKGDRQHWLVEKLTELGVQRLIPLITQRSVANATQAKDRMQRWMIEACKQCERSQLMEITAPITLAELTTFEPSTTQRFVAHPYGETVAASPALLSSSAIVVVGPEGGLTDEEVAQLSAAGFAAISFGPLILRVETAAIAAAVLAATVAR